MEKEEEEITKYTNKRIQEGTFGDEIYSVYCHKCQQILERYKGADPMMKYIKSHMLKTIEYMCKECRKLNVQP